MLVRGVGHSHIFLHVGDNLNLLATRQGFQNLKINHGGYIQVYSILKAITSEVV